VLPEETGFQFPLPNNLDWSIALAASLPLFNGGTLRAERTRAEIELDELTVRREAARLRVEQRIRSALHEAMSSWAAIDLSRDAAEAARNNLDLVQDAYSEGAVDIIRLLDAQNQALVAELLAANAIYDFLLDLMAVQRAVGEFDYFRSAEDREKFLSGMRQYFKEEGYVPRESRP
jgi:outer membrane protein TolC